MIDQNQQRPMNNQQTPQQKQQVALQKQFAMKKQQMDRAKLQAKQQGKLPVNAESLDAKISSLVSEKISSLSERADFWHPDPEKDRKLGGPGANQRAREDAAASAKPKEDPKKLRPGESYMDWNKRQQANRTKSESHVPGQPAVRLGAVTAIPQSEREAAKARLLAKTAAKRKEMEKVKEEFEIEEGMSMKDFKANRKKNVRRAASADAEKRGHVGKEWYNSGRKYSPDEAKSGRANMSDEERRTRHRSSIDPEGEDSNYSADKTKNPKKLRKQAAMGESLSFTNFMEARRMDKEGVDRGDAGRSARAERAKASVAAVKKRQSVLDKHEKKTGTKLDISRSKEGQEHARNHPGSRQAPKDRGAKETPQETQNRRVNRSNARVIKHGFTKKEKEASRGMYSSRFD